jgi:hypothetical protein
MTPFQRLRLWVLRGPRPERLAVAAAAGVVVALVALALVPSSGPASVATGSGPAGLGLGASPTASSSGTEPLPSRSSAARHRTLASSAGTALAGTLPGNGSATAAGPGSAATSGEAASPASGASSGQTSGPDTPGRTGGSGTPSGSSGAGAGGGEGCPAGSTDQGVTATEVHIGVVILDLEGQAGNDLVGYPSPSQQEADYQAVIAAVNRGGGVQCRRLVPSFYQANPLDPSEEQATCLQMAQDRLFAAVSVGFVTPPYDDCPSAHQIPTILELPVGPGQLRQFYPYLFTSAAQWRQLIRNYVLGARELGWFSGYRKVGVLEEDCEPNLNRYLLSDLAAIGIPSDRIVTYDYGCPTGLVPPNEVEEAVLSFKTAGVTHVMDAGTTTENDFSKDAEAQDYHPRYSLPDGGSVASFDSPEFAPDPTNFNGALAITAAQWGAPQTPGVPLSPATATCDQIMKAAGLPSAESSEDGASGMACDLVWMLLAAMRHDATLTRVRLAAGLDQVGPFDFSYPQGPADFSGAGVVNGGQFWRPDVYDGSCPCFKVLDASFRPSFP